MERVRKEVVLKGIPASPGIAIGKVYLMDRGTVKTPALCHLDPGKVSAEIERFEEALKRSKEQLFRIKEKIERTKGGKEHVYIIDAHIMILEDRMLIEDTIKTIKKEKVNAEWAFKIVLKKFIDIFNSIEDEYLRERVSDIEHVGDRVLRNLTGTLHEGLHYLKEDVVVVAHDLSPADTGQMVKEKILGFATDMGSRTSHTAIIARSLEIPAVVGLERVTYSVEPDETIIIDGIEGKVVISPSEEILQEYLKRQERYIFYERELLQLKDLPAVTKDGKIVKLMGNIELVEEVSSVIEHGGEGIGLYRTEFLYLNRKDFPAEEEHFETYKKVVEAMAPRPVTIRTLDIGGDKFVHWGESGEANPALGLRAIRFCLKRRDIFKTQLRGILRASAFGKVRIMFPLISGIEELREAKKVLEEVKEELRKEGVSFDEGLLVGIMVEVPSAAMIADLLAREVDFFSIGTNDLLQYTLAIDRVNELVAYLYEPFHPSILRMIKGIVDGGHRHGIEVGICGEMAGDPEYIIILLGLGLDQLSMNALSIPEVKGLIRNVTFEKAKAVAEEALKCSTAAEVKRLLRKEKVLVKKRYPLGIN